LVPPPLLRTNVELCLTIEVDYNLIPIAYSGCNGINDPRHCLILIIA